MSLISQFRQSINFDSQNFLSIYLGKNIVISVLDSLNITSGLNAL